MEKFVQKMSQSAVNRLGIPNLGVHNIIIKDSLMSQSAVNRLGIPNLEYSRKMVFGFEKESQSAVNRLGIPNN